MLNVNPSVTFQMEFKLVSGLKKVKIYHVTGAIDCCIIAVLTKIAHYVSSHLQAWWFSRQNRTACYTGVHCKGIERL